MSPTTTRNFLLVLLTLSSGCIDAIGYLGLGHVFTANMTGNIVMMGLAIGHAQGFAVLRSAIALASFVVGTAIAAILVKASKEKSIWRPAITVSFCVECLILIAFAVFAHTSSIDNVVYALIVCLSVAMGMQTTTVRRLGVAGLTTTVLTSNLANLVEDMIKHIGLLLQRVRTSGQGAQPEDKDAAPKPKISIDTILRASVLVTYCIGAVIGTVAEPHFLMTITWLPVVLLLLVILTGVFYLQRKTA